MRRNVLLRHSQERGTDHVAVHLHLGQVIAGRQLWMVRQDRRIADVRWHQQSRLRKSEVGSEGCFRQDDDRVAVQDGRHSIPELGALDVLNWIKRHRFTTKDERERDIPAERVDRQLVPIVTDTDARFLAALAAESDEWHRPSQVDDPLDPAGDVNGAVLQYLDVLGANCLSQRDALDAHGLPVPICQLRRRIFQCGDKPLNAHQLRLVIDEVFKEQRGLCPAQDFVDVPPVYPQHIGQ